MHNKTQQQTALTALTRLCKTNPDNNKHLKQALTRDLSTFAPYAIEIAKETGDPIGKLLAECLSELSDPDLYITLYEHLAEGSIALGEVYLLISKEMHQMARSGNWLHLANTAIIYAEALSNTGDQQQALHYAQKGACLFQRHADTPDLDYLQSFSLLASILMQTGQMESALLLQKEVVDRQKIKSKTSKAHTANYSRSLLQLCLYHNRVTQLGKAIDYGEQALSNSQALNSFSIDEQYLQLSITRVLADCYEKADQLELSAKYLKTCILLARNLCDHAYDRFILELISTLETLATIEARLGNKSTAHHHCDEAIRSMRKIYHERPQVFAYEYAGTLIVIATVYTMFDKLQDAYRCFAQAIALLEPLQQQFPDAFDSLATALSNRLGIYLEMTRYTEAIQDCYRLICLYRTRPEYKADLAFTLKRLADCRIHNGEMFKAERSIHTSVQHFYDLTEKDEYFLSDLCYALSSMAVIQKNTGDCEQALATVDEIISYMEHNNNHLKNTNLKLYFSVLICQLQCLIDTEQYQQGVGSANTLINAITDSRYKESKLLAEALLMHSDILIGLNKTPDALDIALQATQHYRFLLENNPDLLSYKIDLAHSLSRVCFLQSSDQPQQALATIKEVLNIYAKTPHLITDELLAEKAKALAYQADLALMLDKKNLAIESMTEALQLQKKLVNLMDKHTDYNLLRFHQVNMQEAKGLLDAMGSFPDREELREEFTMIEQQFNTLVGA